MDPRARLALVVATSNLGKLREIRALLADQPVELFRPVELLGHSPIVVEDGERFEDNAVIKAKALAALTGKYTLADDSGLEVDALDGQPGVHSARYAGEQATDQDNNRALLSALASRGGVASPARFRCVVALASPEGRVVAVKHGVCEGRLTNEPRGTNGFGYDPLFVVTELGQRTMAELADDEKNAVSHRGRALRAMLPELARLVREQVR